MSQTTTQERPSTLDAFAAMKDAGEGASLPATVPGPLSNTAAAMLGQSSVAMVVPVPRDVRKVLEEIKVLAAIAGDKYYYRIPFRDRRTGKVTYAEDGNINMANDLARVWRNMQVDCAFVDEGSHWVFYGRVIDRENGVTMIRPFRARPTASRIGGDDAERRVDASFQIGVSKAERNVILNYLRPYADFALQEAKASAVDKYGKRIDHYRKAVPKMLAERGIELKRVEAVVGRKAEQWLAEDVAKVVAMMNSIEDGMATLNDTFPPLPGEDQDKGSGLDQFASGEAPSSDAGSGSASTPVNDAAGLAAEADETEMVRGSATAAPAASAVPLQTYRQMIDGVLKVAMDKTMPAPEERIAAINGPLREIWVELMPDTKFLDKALQLGVEVVQGKMPAHVAKKMMENLVP